MSWRGDRLFVFFSPNKMIPCCVVSNLGIGSRLAPYFVALVLGEKDRLAPKNHNGLGVLEIAYFVGTLTQLGASYA